MTTALLISTVFFFFLSLAFAKAFMDYRKRLHIEQERYGAMPIQKIKLDALDGIFNYSTIGPSLEWEVNLVGKGNLNVAGATSDTEAWILAMLAKKSKHIFEFGTCTGKTAYIMAKNSERDASVTTLTLHPDQVASYAKGNRDCAKFSKIALEESIYSSFLYTGTPQEARISQLYGDSKDFDETPYLNKCDLVFVDGAHTYSYIKSDTTKALRMVTENGIIIWHDYRPGNDPKDVTRYLNELSVERKLVHIDQTSLIAYRHQSIKS